MKWTSEKLRRYTCKLCHLERKDFLYGGRDAAIKFKLYGMLNRMPKKIKWMGKNAEFVGVAPRGRAILIKIGSKVIEVRPDSIEAVVN